jgi:hypothetical protein
LYEKYIVLFFKLFPKVLFEAFIINASNIMLIFLFDFCYLVLNVVLENLFDLLSYLREVFLSCLDCHLQLRLVKVNPRLVRIDSGILKQHLVELILVGFKVLVQVVPLFIAHYLSNFFLIVAVAVIILGLLTIILFSGFFRFIGYLHHGWEEDEGHLVVVVKEALELVSQCLKLQLFLFQALKHYCLDIFLRI